jgi:hypothetical protein
MDELISKKDSTSMIYNECPTVLKSEWQLSRPDYY